MDAKVFTVWPDSADGSTMPTVQPASCAHVQAALDEARAALVAFMQGEHAIIMDAGERVRPEAGWRPAALPPAEGVRVIVCTDEDVVGVAELIAGRWLWAGWLREAVGVTHWQPMPRPVGGREGGEPGS